jgi:hypothetical protein
MAKEFEAMRCRTVIANNRTGSSGLADTAIVARATPDGHTLAPAVSGLATRRLSLAIG